ncbi:hypothetical protein ABEF95_000481 [Exophiala dermatitidis]
MLLLSSRYNRAIGALISIALILLLYITLATETTRSWLAISSNFRIRPTPNPFSVEELYQEVNITDWGGTGRRVKKLSHWATSLIKDPSADRSAFESALLLLFDFLRSSEGSIYKPWSSSTNSATSSLQLGIVVCVGFKNVHMAGHLIASLRRVHDSKAAIEVAYAGDDDLSPGKRAFLKTLDPELSFINLLDVFPTIQSDLLGGGWAMKPFALLASSYPRTILVDADAIFLSNPDIVFDAHPGLSRTGALFFHDRGAGSGRYTRGKQWLEQQMQAANISPSHHLTNKSLFWSGQVDYEADSGVVALDKSRPAIVLGLMFATWMNTKKVRDAVTYTMFHGDKETFWIAMELSGVEYSFDPWYAGAIGEITDREDWDEGDRQRASGLGRQEKEESVVLPEPEKLCSDHMLHLDHSGQAPFWFNGGMYRDKRTDTLELARMTHYWVGNSSDIRLTQPESGWFWLNGVIACLLERNIMVLPEDVKRVVERIEKEAKRVDELAVDFKWEGQGIL